MRIALTGNPNSGKTTMYNALTGRNERVGNWAGVTVEKKRESDQERILRRFGGTDRGRFTGSLFYVSVYIGGEYYQQLCKNENPDAIINIVDATNLSRSLFLQRSFWNWESRW